MKKTSQSPTRNTFTVNVMFRRRHRTGQDILDRTRREQYTVIGGTRERNVDRTAVNSMPIIPGSRKVTVKLVWFRLATATDSSLWPEEERARLGLERDLEAQAEWNAKNPNFARKFPNGDAWTNQRGQPCHLHFGHVHHHNMVYAQKSKAGFGAGELCCGVKLPRKLRA